MPLELELGMAVGGNFETGALRREDEMINRKLDVVAGFGAHTGGWSNWTGSIRDFSFLWPTHRKVACAIPFFPEEEGAAAMAKAANGDYNSFYTTCANGIVTVRGHGNAILRPGWEFQGNWFPWGVDHPANNTIPTATYNAQYIAIFRHIVNSFRSIAGQSFKFDWCPNWAEGGGTMPVSRVEACYPGDAYVDIIGLDVYEQNPWNDPSICSRWFRMENAAVGMKWQIAFATAHGKQVSYPEWATGGVGPTVNGVTDNPYFIDQMARLMKRSTAPVAYHCYWDRPPSEGYNGNLSSFPAISIPGKPLQFAMFQNYWQAPPLIKGINIGGANAGATTIYGRPWISHTQANIDGMSITSTPIPDKIVAFDTTIAASAFKPPAIASVAGMLNTQVSAQETNMVIQIPLPNGKYFITLHSKEITSFSRMYTIKIQNIVVAVDVGNVPADTYMIHGPYVAVVDQPQQAFGTLRIDLVKFLGSPNISGITIEQFEET